MSTPDLPTNLPYPRLSNTRRSWLKGLTAGDSVISFGEITMGLDGPQTPGAYTLDTVIAVDKQKITVLAANPQKNEGTIYYNAKGLYYCPGEDQSQRATGWIVPADDAAARQALLVQTVAMSLCKNDWEATDHLRCQLHLALLFPPDSETYQQAQLVLGQSLQLLEALRTMQRATLLPYAA